jgi:hypothetical protein
MNRRPYPGQELSVLRETFVKYYGPIHRGTPVIVCEVLPLGKVKVQIKGINDWVTIFDVDVYPPNAQDQQAGALPDRKA